MFLHTHVQNACTKEANIHVQGLSEEGPNDARSLPLLRPLPSSLSCLHLLLPSPASLANIVRDVLGHPVDSSVPAISLRHTGSWPERRLFSRSASGALSSLLQKGFAFGIRDGTSSP